MLNETMKIFQKPMRMRMMAQLKITTMTIWMIMILMIASKHQRLKKRMPKMRKLRKNHRAGKRKKIALKM